MKRLGRIILTVIINRLVGIHLEVDEHTVLYEAEKTALQQPSSVDLFQH